MDDDTSKKPGAFSLSFSYRPLEQLGCITNIDNGSPQPGNGTSTSASKTSKPRPRRRRPAARSPNRKLAVKLPDTLYFAHHAIDKLKYPKRFTKPLMAMKRPISDAPLNFEMEDYEDSERTMTDVVDDGESVLPSIENDIGDNEKPQLVQSGHSAVARKISATLDADDEFIVRMKQERRTDKEIAEALIASGGTKYNYKSIGSRWRRLRHVLAEARDRELDLGTIRWSMEDDAALRQALRCADEDVSRLKANAEEQRWALVATHLQELKKDAMFSKKACFERATALASGITLIPPTTNADPVPSDPKPIVVKRYREEERENLTVGQNANAPPTMAPITNLSYAAQLVKAGNVASGMDISAPLISTELMTVQEMKNELRERGLTRRGPKEVLKQRVLAARAGVKGLKPSPTMFTHAMPRPLPYESPHTRVPHDGHRAISISSTADNEPLNKKANFTSFSTHLYTGASLSKCGIAVDPNDTGYRNPAIISNSTPGSGSRFTLNACAHFIYKYGDIDTLDPYQEPVSSGRRLFLYGFHDTMTTDLVYNLLQSFSIQAVHPLGVPGHFVVDCTDVETSVEVLEALNGKIYSGRFMVVRNAHEVATSFRRGEKQQASVYTLPSQSTTPTKGFKHNAIDCRLRVTNVPTLAGLEDLMSMLVNAQKCEPIEPGSFIVTFHSSSSASMAKTVYQGMQICGQHVKFETIKDGTPVNNGQQSRTD